MKIDIFSGFLGAGKTTLIKKLISEAYKGEKLVLIENEFGEIGIDGGFMKDAGIEITEMNSGCICCSLVGDFAEALKKVYEQFSPDRIIIEPSGVGKLSDVTKAVVGADLPGAEINACTTVVNAAKCKMYMKNFGEFFNDQIENAGCVVFSHAEKVSEQKLKEAVALVRSLNATAEIVTTPLAEISGEQILAAMEHTDTLTEELERLKEEAHHHHEHHHEHHHDHEHGEHCCCGHDHEHEHEHHHEHHHDHEHGEHCCCGHDHEHEHHHEHHHDHEHGEHCCCGHDHDHEHEHHHEHHHDHEHGEHCCCGHDHEHEHEHHHEHEHGEHCCCGHDHEHEHEHHHEHHHDHEHGEHCCCGHDHGHHHADEVFTSWGVETAKKFTASELEEILGLLDSDEKYGTILRAKGIVAGENGWIHFDYIPGGIDVRSGSAETVGRLCVIGCELNEEELSALFGI